MATPRKASMMTPAKSSKSSMADSIKVELMTKATDLVEKVLKPKHVLPPDPGQGFNYIADIAAMWSRNYFYFVATYASPGSNAPAFESKFARMEHIGDGKFALSFIRHTGEWVRFADALSVDESLKVIRDDALFTP
jgi:hypothetical protein